MRWVVCGLWRILKCCTSMVFEKIEVEPAVVMQLLQQQWEEIAGCDGEVVQQPTCGQQGRGESPEGWVKPPFGTIKVNCDGAWCNHTGVGGVGGVGKVLYVSSIMVEAEAMRLALLVWKWASGLFSWKLIQRSLST
ncbi:hypothetical protein D8674_016366 [Pyrus ussuriensis x Pyrus communis]|uniref:RNase H type-1 domain-containing protein n=1 Tax=Pyrus ussuriensis x Pyrus communis TaxID=2448454 RepID=A0A5N5H9L6_9ROSA|nr:hypothetical protein D8674_016366 [Pyrus ussuriensis x Pyrus communis]